MVNFRKILFTTAICLSFFTPTRPWAMMVDPENEVTTSKAPVKEGLSIEKLKEIHRNLTSLSQSRTEDSRVRFKRIMKTELLPYFNQGTNEESERVRFTFLYHFLRSVVPYDSYFDSEVSQEQKDLFLETVREGSPYSQSWKNIFFFSSISFQDKEWLERENTKLKKALAYSEDLNKNPLKYDLDCDFNMYCRALMKESEENTQMISWVEDQYLKRFDMEFLMKADRYLRTHKSRYDDVVYHLLYSRPNEEREKEERNFRLLAAAHIYVKAREKATPSEFGKYIMPSFNPNEFTHEAKEVIRFVESKK